MITQEKFIESLLRYADSEVIPALPTSGKWIMGAGIIMMTNNCTALMQELLGNSIIRSLGVVNDEGLINEQVLFEAFSKSAATYGPMTINIPIVGRLSFNSNDIEKLRRYVNE